MIARWRVFLGFVAAGLFALFSHVGSWPRALLGLLLALAGLWVRGWAAGYLEKGKRLAQDGPYAWVRHPLYTGSFLMALGVVIAGTASRFPVHAAVLWFVFLFLFLWIYPRRIVDEERALEKTFGDAWRAFTSKNHRFIPRGSPARRENPDRFERARYLKNREYNAAIGWAAGAALVIFKGIAGL